MIQFFNMKIDLRSDTVTKPTQAMLERMMQAKVGDDVYAEDPTVNELQDHAADLFGKETALYFPTGSMANQAAIKLHTQPGEQLICDKWAHVYNYEGGGASFNSGVSCKLIDGHRGKVTADQVEASINPPDFYHSPLTSLVCLENTTNKGGGACYDLKTISEVREVCDRHGLGLHLDGARLMNALVATQIQPKDIGQYFDTISICLSKGLGAPMGTVLVGDNKLMKNALRVRKVLGGGMRQIGFMAAAGLYGLKHQVERLADDHQKAREIATTLERSDLIEKVEPVETNIIIFQPKDFAVDDLMQMLDKEQIRISQLGKDKFRIVTHLDYTDEQHQRMISLLKTFEHQKVS